METGKTYGGIQRIRERERERETERERIRGEREVSLVERGKRCGLILTVG